jgi:hypothetical protein
LGLQGQIVYVALRDIAVDEELTFDYAMNDDDPNEIMKCQCGAESCRGVIRRFRAKPDKKIVDGQAASPSSWKTPFIATCMVW